MSVAKGKFYIFPVSDLHLGHEKFNSEFLNFGIKHSEKQVKTNAFTC